MRRVPCWRMAAWTAAGLLIACGGGDAPETAVATERAVVQSALGGVDRQDDDDGRDRDRDHDHEHGGGVRLSVLSSPPRSN